MKIRRSWGPLLIVILSLFLGYVGDFPIIDGRISDSDQSLNTNGIDDFEIVLTTNRTSIGRYGGIKGELNLSNNGVNPVSDVEINFTLSNDYLKFTPTYPTNDTISLINPSESVVVNIEAELNITGVESSNAADVVLLFDSSGSMSNEIQSVKQEFLAVVNSLTQQISSLRIGMVVYGWSKYSEYPASSINNYVELTDDFGAVNDLINELYASGAVEPWGDAFYLITNWDWRTDVPKLAILIGDEDCDPGHLVGTESTGTYYNDSQLLDVITTLKEKDVQINTVITDVTDTMIENQFQWIASYTDGKCVYLEDLLTGEDPINLPQLIEQWTLEISREQFTDLIATVDWTELIPGDNQDYQVIKTQQIMIDLAPPSITVSTFISEVSTDNYELELTIKPRDFSGIEQVNMYWTDELFTSPTEPIWHFKIITTEISGYYIDTISNLLEGDIISFYIEASDTLFNVGTTMVYNITIGATFTVLRTLQEFFFTEDNSSRNIGFNFTAFNSLGSTEEQIGYLWIESEQLIEINFVITSGVTYSVLKTGSNYTIIKITQENLGGFFHIEIRGDASDNPIKIRWDYALQISTSAEFSSYIFKINTLYRLQLVEVELISPEGEAYLSLGLAYGDILASLYIFDENWNLVAKVRMYDPIKLTDGKYYLWMEQSLREGGLRLIYSVEPVTTGDPYYSPVMGYPLLSILFGVFMISSLILLGQRQKRRGKA